MCKDPGYLVTLKDGREGRTFTKKGLVGSKIPVYLFDEDGQISTEPAILCIPQDLVVKGYID